METSNQTNKMNAFASNIKTNRKYKDSVFSALFSEKQSLLELYKVLHPDDTKVTDKDIEKVVLGNVLVIRRYNDTAMSVRGKLIILTEHQSTINLNMPVRLLLYLAEEYEKLLKQKNMQKALYREKVIELPAPEFYVVYTGDDECEEYLHLSDAFSKEYRNNQFIQLNVKVIRKEDEHNILGGYNVPYKVDRQEKGIS